MTRRTLDPSRECARGVEELCALLVSDASPELARAFEHGTRQLDDAIAAAFPHNLLWDLEYPLAASLRVAQDASDPVATLSGRLEALAALQRLFGDSTVVHFRYIHDFIYGFDWARWVARDPEGRADVGPFDPPFVAAMHKRGAELIATIAKGTDEKYPPLSQGTHRNPFPFRREPKAELAILRALARDDALPVRAWDVDAIPVWDRPFASMREQMAASLGYAADA